MIDTPESAPAAPPKLDPETLVLRGNPRRMVRFRRGAIIAIAAMCSTAIVGVTWMALKPSAFRIVAGGDDQMSPAKVPPDALANAPKNYGDVPKLGLPLPGDLGRPILAHSHAAGAMAPQPGGIDPAAQAAEAERQRLEAERKAARESGVMMPVAGARRQGDVAVAAGPSGTTQADASSTRVAIDPERDPSGQQRKADFMAAKDEKGDINPHALNAPVSPYTLTAGTVIAASLITGLNSDLPGVPTRSISTLGSS